MYCSLLFQTIPAANDVATRPDLKSHADATTKMMMLTADAARIPWSIVAVDKIKVIINSSLSLHERDDVDDSNS
jgi:hypothetical protein